MSEVSNAMKSADQIVMTCPLAQYAEKIKNEEITKITAEFNEKIGQIRKDSYNAGYQQACIDQMNIEKACEQVLEDHQKNEKPPHQEKFTGCESLIRERDQFVADANELIEYTLDKMMEATDAPGQIVLDRSTMIKAISLIYTMVPKIINPEDIREGDVIYCEYRNGNIQKWYVSTVTEGKIYYAGRRGQTGYDRLEQAGIMWRAWTQFPTKEQVGREEWKT